MTFASYSVTNDGFIDSDDGYAYIINSNGQVGDMIIIMSNLGSKCIKVLVGAKFHNL